MAGQAWLRNALVGVLALVVSQANADWTRFRGPNGSGVSADSQPTPVRWSATENLKWKVPLPGPGSSSPIVVGDRVFVTCWSGYGTSRTNLGNQADLRRHLICLDRHTGKTLWSKSVDPVLPEDDFQGMFTEHGYASHTPTSDGQRVYVYFGKTGALAFDLEGNQLWHTKIGSGSDPRGWGSASSPILYKNLLIITASAESEAMVALDKETGKEVWRQEAAGLGGTWGTPVLVPIDEERTDLVLGVPYEVWAFNPDNGKLRWYCEAMDTDSYCSSLVASDGIVYGIEGRGGGSIAIRAGGKGDVGEGANSQIVWTGRDPSRIGSPLLVEGRIYSFSNGRVRCLNAADGKLIFEERLTGGSAPARPQGPPGGGIGGFGPPGPGGPGGRGGGGAMFGADYASPVVADGKIYFVTRNGDMFVLKAGPKFEQLAVNRVTADREDFSATPAISHGQIFLRSDKHLYCVADSGQ